MLARVDDIDADIAELDARIEAEIGPFADQVDRLDAIPRDRPHRRPSDLAEIGVDMSRFPTPAHLASWAKFAPGVKESAGKQKGRGA
jgi:transposase